MAGLQKRYAPAVQRLSKQLKKEKTLCYTLSYMTGAYPEGDALLDLFIHPLDLVTYLFGKASVISCETTGPQSMLLMLKHGETIGTLDLSTMGSWTDAEENLKVCTSSGIYRLSQMEELSFTGTQGTLAGIPLEKIHQRNKSVEYLYRRNNFNPIMTNNQVVSQGYYDELVNFLEVTEGRRGEILTGFKALEDTYLLIEEIKKK